MAINTQIAAAKAAVFFNTAIGRFLVGLVIG